MRTSTKSHTFSIARWIVIPVVAAVLLLPAAPAFAGEACPNEQLRRESNINPNTGEPYDLSLPDCRAYEQVTPVSKEGNTFSADFIAENGESVDMRSGGGVSGSLARLEGLGSSNGYLAQRSGSGWETSPLDPPAYLFLTDALESDADVTHDLSEQVWVGHLVHDDLGKGEQAWQFDIRQPDGSFVGNYGDELAGGNAPEYLGGSSNLSVLVFVDTGALLPAAKALGNGGTHQILYEITGAVSGSPALSFVPVEDSGNALSSTTDATLGSGGGSQSSGSEFHAVSRDGSKVFFDVAPTDTSYNGDTKTQVFARINGTETVDLSEPTLSDCTACLETTPGADKFEGASEDGSKVFFTTEQELLPGQSTKNIYEYDFEEPAGHRIVLVSAGAAKPEVQSVTRISDDGSHVYFVANGVLTSAKNNAGQEATTGAENFYVYDTETHETKFIADLCSGSGKSGATTDAQCPAASTATDSALWSAIELRPAQATPEGRYLVFTSVADLTPNDTSTVAQIFRYDAETGELVRVSTGEAGYDNNGNTTTNPASIKSPGGESTAHGGTAYADFENSDSYKRSVSADGSYVVFTTTEALSPRDTNDAPDVYEWHNGNVSLISDGTDPQGSTFASMSSSGNSTFFFTQDSLVGQDTGSGDQDIYDARIDGGFPAPPPPPSPGCSGDSCQPLSALFTPPGPTGSSTQAAGENLAPATTTTTTTTTTKPKALTKAQKLANALKQCKKDKSKTKRASCKKAARRKYAPVKQKAKKKNTKKKH